MYPNTLCDAGGMGLSSGMVAEAGGGVGGRCVGGDGFCSVSKSEAKRRTAAMPAISISQNRKSAI